MNTRNFIFTAITLAAIGMATACRNTAATASEDTDRPLKEAVGDRFLIGVAMNTDQVAGRDSMAANVVRRHFNSVVAENCMKSEVIHPAEGVYNFSGADSLVDFAEANSMSVVGHCLIWHSQLAKWFDVDDKGKPVTAEVLKARMKEHISTIVGRYKGRIKGWDVVNEAFEGDGSYRQSTFYKILGEEYIPLAFQWAHEADPEAELYYNDYGMDGQAKRESVIKLVKTLKERGLRIDAVGMQGHMGMDYPDIAEFEKSIEAYAAAGVKVMVSEWDMSALPTIHEGANISDTASYSSKIDPYPHGLPDSVSTKWNARIDSFFRMFIRHADVIARVTAWGVSDGDSWKNDFPVAGRTDYPLLFDRNYQPKDFVRNFCAFEQDSEK